MTSPIASSRSLFTVRALIGLAGPHRQLAPDERALVPAVEVVDDVQPEFLPGQPFLDHDASLGVSRIEVAKGGAREPFFRQRIAELQFLIVLGILDADRRASPARFDDQREAGLAAGEGLAGIRERQIGLERF